MAPETRSNRKRQSSAEPSTSRGGKKSKRKQRTEIEKAPGSSTEASSLTPFWQALDSLEDLENYIHSNYDFEKITDLLRIIYVIALAIKNLDPTLPSRAIDADPVDGKILQVLKVNNPKKGRQKKFYVKIVDESGKSHTRKDLAQLLDKYVGAE
uniref:Uncharacterized protein n=1 Tax=Tetranychus urticae TaxID=32264 RepID=T1JR25_TETUR